MSDVGVEPLGRFHRLVIVPFALWAEPVERVYPERVPALDERLKEIVLQKYRERKAGGDASLRRTDSGASSYRYAGYLYSYANTPTEYAAIFDQLQPTMFLAQIIDEALDEIFPRGTTVRRTEVGPPTTNESDAEKYLRFLVQQVQPVENDNALARGRLADVARSAPSATSILLAVALLGVFALAHAWIQYRSKEELVGDWMRDQNAEHARIIERIAALEGECNVEGDRVQQSVDVDAQMSVPAPVDPTAPKWIRIGR